MLSADLEEVARRLSNKGLFKSLFGLIEDISNARDTLPEVIQNSSTRGNLINRVSAAARSYRPQAVFAATNEYLSLLGGLDEKSSDVSTVELREEISSFVDVWESYLLNSSEDATFELFFEASRLQDFLKGFTAANDLFSTALFDSSLHGNDQAVLDLRLDGSYGINELRASLNSISRMYDLVVALTNPELKSSRLQLVRVETGSLQIVARGAVKAIAVLKKFFSAFASYALISKRLVDVEVSSRALSSQVALMQALSSEGIDVDEAKDALSEASALLARHTAKLLGETESISINGTLLSLGRDVGILAPSRYRQLNYKKDSQG